MCVFNFNNLDFGNGVLSAHTFCFHNNLTVFYNFPCHKTISYVPFKLNLCANDAQQYTNYFVSGYK